MRTLFWCSMPLTLLLVLSSAYGQDDRDKPMPGVSNERPGANRGEFTPPRTRPGGPASKRPFDGPGPEGAPLRRPGVPMRPLPGMPAQERLELLKETDPEMHALVVRDFELERRSHEMARRIRAAAREDIKRAHGELTKLAAEQFAVRQERRQLHLQRMEEELKELRQSLEKRAEQKDEIISRRVEDLLGEGNDLEF